ncbi:MAG: M28 family metallopeptidase [Sphingomicrobium sp.]
MKPVYLLGAAAAAILSTPALAKPAIGFDPARLSAIDKMLGSDAFEGRGPNTRAETKTVAYIVDQFKAAGVQPGGDVANGQRGWTQAVPLLKSDIVGTPGLTLDLGNGPAMSLTQGDQISVKAPLNGMKSVDLTNVPLVFVGYGTTAPERNWDDFKGMDVKGKLLVEFINDPDFDGPIADGAGNSGGDFGGKAMTYYGRWTYKYEEAARRGAAGLLIIHETDPASYGWATVKNSNTNTQFDIVQTDPAAVHAPIEAWIQRDLGARIFEASGMTFDQAKAMSRTRAFKPVELKARMTTRINADVSTITSQNVVGLLPGTRYPDETVIYSAHWDHLGIGKPDSTGDTIYNGALDNATGIAQLIEQARVFAAQPRTQRSIVFLAVTAEEKGLLGSEYYAAHPLYAPGKTVGALNTDGGQLWGKAKNFTISGNAKLGLLDMLIAEGAKQGRYYSPDPHPEAGHFFRSDHFSMAKVGIPAISFGDGNDLVNGGIERGEALGKSYVEKNYHQPSDEWSSEWDFTGMAQDAQLLHNLGRNLANSRAWPEWSADSEFKAARDATASDRAGGTAVIPAAAMPVSQPDKKGERGR